MVGRNLQLRPSLGPLRRVFRVAKNAIPPLNFLTLHWAYFIVTCLLCSVIFWATSTPPRSVRYVDSLFLVVSAITMAGLNTINLSTLNTFQQIMLCLLIFVGSPIFVSAFALHVRKKAFEVKFKSVVERRHRLRRRLSRSRSRSRNPSQPAERDGITLDEIQPSQTSTGANDLSQKSNDEVQTSGELKPRIAGKSLSPLQLSTSGLDNFADLQSESDRESRAFSPSAIKFRDSSQERRQVPGERRGVARWFSMQGVGAAPASSSHPNLFRPHSREKNTTEAPERTGTNLPDYFPTSGRIARNSAFHNLTAAERTRLGGVEYKAIRFLSLIVPLYIGLFQLLGCVSLGAYVATVRPTPALKNGLNPWWVGIFNGVSAFNNSGMSLLDANMVAFQKEVYMLITMGLMILAGNTCFPIFLRLIVWTMWKLLPDNEQWHGERSTLRFLLDHPRRCYTNLFPSQHTWWLLLSVVTLNGIDWAAFEILNIGNKEITALPTGIAVIDGLFQALAVRSGGFYVVPITSVRISLQCLYVIMMYISVYPVVITMRNSNVYEERSLGIYADDPGFDAWERQNRSFLTTFKKRFTEGGQKSYFVRQQLRAQLAHDLWWIVLAVFFIMIVEGSLFDQDPATYSVFNVVFEVVSGYGTVGISTGLPDQAYSFCGDWHTLSKLILCAVMLRGRHRGLPVAIDKAVMLPGVDDEAEEEDAALRMERVASRGSLV